MLVKVNGQLLIPGDGFLESVHNFCTGHFDIDPELVRTVLILIKFCSPYNSTVELLVNHESCILLDLLGKLGFIGDIHLVHIPFCHGLDSR